MGEEKEKPKEKEKDPKKEEKEKKEEKDPKKKEDKKEEKKEVDDKKKEKETTKETTKDTTKDGKETDLTKESKPSKFAANSAPATISADPPKQQGRRKGLKSGSVIKTEKNAFKIERTLGSGAFGHVYKVISMDNDIDLYAMKTEWEEKERKDRMSPLKMELCVLQDANSEMNKNKECFVKLIDKGRTTNFRFFVMELVSHTLQDILTVMCKREMPTQSAVFLMRATYLAIDALHGFGYIHRDIKPHNFAIGLTPFEKRIYILGFGISRMYWDDEERRGVRPPRKNVKFVGTLKYCSRTNHSEKEQSRRDDYESWVYMCLEFFHECNITWDNLASREEIYTQKKNLFSSLDKSELKMPSSFVKILKEIDGMLYSSALSKKFADYVMDVMKETKTNDKTTLIWEIEKMPVSKARKKGAKNRVQNDEDSDERRKRDDKAKRREILAKKKRVEEELMRVMREVEGESKEKKEDGRKRRSSDQRKRPSGGRRKRGASREEESDDYDDHDDYEDDDDESYEEEKHRRKASQNKRYRDEDLRVRKKETKRDRKRASRASTERTYDDPRDRRKRSMNDRRKSSKKNSSKRRTRHRTIDQEEKLVKIQDSPTKDGKGVRKRSSKEKGDEEGERKYSGQRVNKEGPTEGSNNKETVSAAHNDGSDKKKK